MLRNLINRKFGTTLYVQIWENLVRITDVKTSVVFEDMPFVAIETNSKGKKIISAVGQEAKVLASQTVKVVNPFSHPRALLSDFQVGERFLQYAVSSVLGAKLISTSPFMIMHPMEKLEGGLTAIEKRALRELALGAGALEAVIYTGSQLLLQELDYESLRANEESESDAVSSTVSSVGWVIIILLVLLPMFFALSSGTQH